ncbi:MAG: cytosolic protein [Thermoplasmata archaeon]|nr:cytosolic protein [Thermoplasmata archaeon]
MECKKDRNSVDCTCTYPGCSKHGVCCDCIRSHKAMRELPGCFFPPEVEKTWERSYEAFAELVKEGRV